MRNKQSVPSAAMRTTTEDVQHAHNAERRGQWALALRCWQRAVKRDTNWIEYRLRAAACAERLGDVAGALAHYDAAAEWYARQGFVLKAVAVRKRAIQLLHAQQPSGAACIGEHLALAACLETLHFDDEAHAEYAAALREMPDRDPRRAVVIRALRALEHAPIPGRG